jgi:hypothetical protein
MTHVIHLCSNGSALLPLWLEVVVPIKLTRVGKQSRLDKPL